MEKTIYTSGYVAENGDIIIKGVFRTDGTDNLIFIKSNGSGVTAELINVDAGTTELPEKITNDICESHLCGCCPLDGYCDEESRLPI